MRQLEPRHIASRSVATLGLDPDKHALTSSEALAAALRRAAGFLCPCAGSTLIRNVVEPMRGLVENIPEVKALAEDVLEQLIALGDLFEYRDLTKSGSVILYAGPSAFVPRASGTVILLGISADQVSALPPDLESRIEAVNCVRLLRPQSGEDLQNELKQIGLIEIPYDRWTTAPANQTAEALVTRCDGLLLDRPSSGEVPGLLVLDPESPVSFYRDRWFDPAGKSGRFVARRSQAYGAPLWCYVHLDGGQPLHLMDLPAPNSRWRGCDEAWHLQMAIDARRGAPQQFTIRKQPDGQQDLVLYSPIPMWTLRRWDAIGKRVSAQGCLMAFRFDDSEIEEECRFARSALWLEQRFDGRKAG